MTVLLVQLPTSHLGAKEKVYPLGLSRLASTIPEHVAKYALDMNVHPDPWQELKHLLETTAPETVVLSFRNMDPLAGHQASYLSSLKTAAQLCRTLLPAVRIIAGGPAFSMFARRLMETVDQIDYGLKGEGERIFSRLMDPSVRPDQLPGILWRRGTRIHENPMGRKIHMDDLPPMDLNGFSPATYLEGNAYVAAMGIEGKRGCDLNCGYCLYPFLGGAKVRLRDPVRIADEIEELNKTHGVSFFHFTDPVLNRPADHFESICREIINRNLSAQWTGFFREDTLSESQVDLARKAGLAAIYFSGDALTTHGLDLLQKKLTKDDILEASRITARTEVLTMCHFLVNLPGEEDHHIREATQMLEKLLEIHHSAGNLGAVIFNHVRLYPMAPLTRQLIKNGTISAGTDLMYPVYYNPEKHAHLLHDFETLCHSANVYSRLGIKDPYMRKESNENLRA